MIKNAKSPWCMPAFPDLDSEAGLPLCRQAGKSPSGRKLSGVSSVSIQIRRHQLHGRGLYPSSPTQTDRSLPDTDAFCDQYGRLDLDNKTAFATETFAPWYSFPDSPVYKERIIFGHWAALEGNSQRKKIHALDTGCVWGRSLTALNLDDYSTTSVDCCYQNI